ncbi:DUF4097 domain-containing protein [Bacillus alkalisoli]|uniref:DUF4097 domain-containing protein n=1 Tax=Bacillus alkalisoli TaxID=2011008 RepID=UPI0012FF3092|nr:DUF4097 domain-containing protein [Bacillus alkalisoli]
MRKLFIFVLILLALFVVYESGNFAKLSWNPWSTGSGTDSAKVSGVDLIEVDASGVGVTIVPQKGDSVEAKLEGKGSVTVKKKGSTIMVDYERERSFRWFSFKNNKVRVYIPEDYSESIALNSGAGNINFEGRSAAEPFQLDRLTLKVGAGNITLKNIEAESFEGNISAGNVRADYLVVGSGKFDLKSGNVNVKKYVGPLEAKVTSGNFTMEMAKLTGDVSVKVTSGRMDLELPKDADFTLNGKVTSGKVSVRHPMTIEKESRTEVAGTNGDGTFSVDVQVTSGSMTIR